MKESTYAPMYEKLMREAGPDGMSCGQLAGETGSSRQTAYAWVRKTHNTLREIGKSSEGGKLYIWNEIPRARPTNGVRGDGGVEVGTTFTVTRLRFDGGKVIATLSGAGAEVEAELT